MRGVVAPGRAAFCGCRLYLRGIPPSNGLQGKFEYSQTVVYDMLSMITAPGVVLHGDRRRSEQVDQRASSQVMITAKQQSLDAGSNPWARSEQRAWLCPLLTVGSCGCVLYVLDPSDQASMRHLLGRRCRGEEAHQSSERVYHGGADLGGGGSWQVIILPSTCGEVWQGYGWCNCGARGKHLPRVHGTRDCWLRSRPGLTTSMRGRRRRSCRLPAVKYRRLSCNCTR